MKRRNFFSAMLAAGALILSGCGASKGPGTPKANSETLPVLKVEQGKKYYVDNSEDLVFQKRMAEAIEKAINENPDSMDVKKLDAFIEKEPLSAVEFENRVEKFPNGLVAHYVNVQKLPFHVVGLIGPEAVKSYNYKYKFKAFSLFGNGKSYGHIYHAKALPNGTIEVTGHKSKREGMELYLHLCYETASNSSGLWNTTEKEFGRSFDIPDYFQRLLFALDYRELEESGRLVLIPQIKRASMKRPLEDIIQQLGGDVVDDPKEADYIVGVKLVGYPYSRDLKHVLRDIENGDTPVAFNSFQQEISMVSLGGNLAQVGQSNAGAAIAGLGVAMVLFGGPDPRFHYGVYGARVIDRSTGENFTRIVVADGPQGKGWRCMNNDPMWLQAIAYDAAGILVGKPNHKQ